MALPAGWLARRIGYKGGIIAGLLMVAVGCLWFIPATSIATFSAFLLGVCVVSMGLTFLETVANPYTTVLGAPQFAAVRINVAQSFNGVGWVVGPWLGSMFFYSKDGAQAAHQTLWIPYSIIAGVVLVLCVVFFFAPMPDLVTKDEYHLDNAETGTPHSIWARPHFVGAVAAQFLYVAAQSGIFAFFINYVISEIPNLSASMKDFWLFGGSSGSVLKEGVWRINESGAAKLMSTAFICFLAGRVTGSVLLNKFSAHKMIGTYALINIVLMSIVVAQLGWLSFVAVFASFFFMSIMFPTIFALGIFGLGKKSKIASSFIVMAIVGGATLPKLMGYIADVHNMSIGFIVPALCFAGVALYGFIWPRLSGASSLLGVQARGGH
jgi:FHS family L-fucose permease-like MFS transporter